MSDCFKRIGINSGRPYCIGVCGVHMCAGTTYFCLLLGIWLSRNRKRRVAIVEASGKKDFSVLEQQLKGKRGNGTMKLRRCFCYASEEEMRKDIAERHCTPEIILYDFGNSMRMHGKMEECDLKCIVGNSGIFSEAYWTSFFARKDVKECICRDDPNCWIPIWNHGNTGKKRKIEIMRLNAKCSIGGYELGTEENLFHLTEAAQEMLVKATRRFRTA